MRFPYLNNKIPPAPYAQIQLTSDLSDLLELDPSSIPVLNTKALLDTGSDVSVLPESLALEMEEKLGLELPYSSFNHYAALGRTIQARSCKFKVQSDKNMIFRDPIEIEFIVVESNLEHSILGRNFLNEYSLVFNGPDLEWGL